MLVFQVWLLWKLFSTHHDIKLGDTLITDARRPIISPLRFFSPDIPDEVRDETKDINYNSFKYSFIGTSLYGSPEPLLRATDSIVKKSTIDAKPSVIEMMKEVFCKSMLSWSYLAFIIFYSGLVLRSPVLRSRGLSENPKSNDYKSFIISSLDISLVRMGVLWWWWQGHHQAWFWQLQYLRRSDRHTQRNLKVY